MHRRVQQRGNDLDGLRLERVTWECSQERELTLGGVKVDFDGGVATGVKDLYL